MSGIILALLCAVFVAFSQLALRKSYQELPPSIAFLFDAIFGLLIWVPLAVFMGISGSVSWGEAIFFAVVSAILSEAIVFSLGFVQIPVALAYLRIEKQSFTKSIKGVFKKLEDYKFALLGGLFNIIGTGFLWLSFSFAPASIASPITGSNGALTVLFSRLILKEKIVARKYVGIVLAFIGIIGIAILRAD